MTDFEPLDKRRPTCVYYTHLQPRNALNTKNYISNSLAINLRNYKYKGSDTGFANIYFYQPFTAWLVEKIPDWIAPNLVSQIFCFN